LITSVAEALPLLFVVAVTDCVPIVKVMVLPPTAAFPYLKDADKLAEEPYCTV
jgi:hypothetical protein